MGRMLRIRCAPPNLHSLSGQLRRTRITGPRLNFKGFDNTSGENEYEDAVDLCHLLFFIAVLFRFGVRAATRYRVRRPLDLLCGSALHRRNSADCNGAERTRPQSSDIHHWTRGRVLLGLWVVLPWTRWCLRFRPTE